MLRERIFLGGQAVSMFGDGLALLAACLPWSMIPAGAPAALGFAPGLNRSGMEKHPPQGRN